ncbi:MAG TPA: DNA-binding response regulator, partial [Cytophagales bacterium]|nr:DNA-binding response regulator [Cytophagales bacterium]
MIQALIVDDHQLFIAGIQAMFSPEDGITVPYSTTNGHEVPHLLAQHPIDIVLLDISMPHLDGPGVLKLMHEQQLTIPVLMLTMHAGL